ncbi:TatD family hydrolase [Pseudarthrobacter niigatensis]|uniref:TatD DNase family protein n=1 Tax=Pseudarthrobacter niigatensis TaxID=369935 RepID=A0AAJ1WGB1_9MICC|nr:TatD family hydrolase [Pseudarthrobacter niigatensis]MDQ0146680.1 TatD DNase family protein [Pseudarthrobacter niigatensis]MDQ0264774.1 TatD DNase family protein [Pseudarthrobacter niigatensis]
MCESSIPPAYRAPAADATTDPGAGRRRDFPPAPEPLPVPVMDNHTHLDFPEGKGPVGVKAALDAAEAVGVLGAVQVGCDLESSRFTVEAVDLDERLLGAVALHPNDAPQYAARGELEAALAEIEQLAAHPRIRAIGETGLDFYRTEGAGLRHQEYSFRRHIDIAKRLDLTLQIHDRDAHGDVVRVLREEGAPERVVFHCFSGDEDLARTCNEQGWWMSFAGTLTFKNAANLRAALAVADRELVMVETDAPFLTPHPHRGRPNASYMVPYTVRAMAELTGSDLAALCTAISENTVRAYGSWS